MPFFLFTLPVLGKIMVHAEPTGFDRNGRCVPFRVSDPPPAEIDAGGGAGGGGPAPALHV